MKSCLKGFCLLECMASTVLKYWCECKSLGFLLKGRSDPDSGCPGSYIPNLSLEAAAASGLETFLCRASPVARQETVPVWTSDLQPLLFYSSFSQPQLSFLLLQGHGFLSRGALASNSSLQSFHTSPSQRWEFKSRLLSQTFFSVAFETHQAETTSEREMSKLISISLPGQVRHLSWSRSPRSAGLCSAGLCSAGPLGYLQWILRAARCRVPNNSGWLRIKYQPST